MAMQYETPESIRSRKCTYASSCQSSADMSHTLTAMAMCCPLPRGHAVTHDLRSKQWSSRCSAACGRFQGRPAVRLGPLMRCLGTAVGNGYTTSWDAWGWSSMQLWMERLAGQYVLRSPRIGRMWTSGITACGISSGVLSCGRGYATVCWWVPPALRTRGQTGQQSDCLSAVASSGCMQQKLPTGRFSVVVGRGQCCVTHTRAHARTHVHTRKVVKRERNAEQGTKAQLINSTRGLQDAEGTSQQSGKVLRIGVQSTSLPTHSPLSVPFSKVDHKS